MKTDPPVISKRESEYLVLLKIFFDYAIKVVIILNTPEPAIKKFRPNYTTAAAYTVSAYDPKRCHSRDARKSLAQSAEVIAAHLDEQLKGYVPCAPVANDVSKNEP